MSEPISFEMMVTEQRFDTYGRQPTSRATMPAEFAYFEGGKVAVEGDITFHGLNVPIAQRMKVEITLIETGAPSLRREKVVGQL